MRIILYILFILLGNTVYAQLKKNDTLREVTILTPRKDIWSESKQELDSTILNRHAGFSINKILELHSNVFVKNYGVSGLSTLSIRGSSAAQTSVYWNGVNINNALTGITDFSNMPASLFDKMEITYGGSESHSVAGGVNLITSVPQFRNQQHGSIAMYGDNIGKASASIFYHLGKGRLQNSTRFAVLQDENNFKFYNPDTQQKDTLKYAEQRQQALLNDLHILVGPRHTLSLHSWIQLNQRQIPAATFEPESKKNENIQNIRNVIQFEGRVNSLFSLKSSLGVLHEKYRFIDSVISLRSDAAVLSVPFNTSIIFSPSYKQRFQADILYSLNRMFTPNQADLIKAGIRLVYAIQRFGKIPLAIKTSVLYERTNIFQTPPAFELSGNYTLRSNIDVYGSVSTRYRMPTLNELYYKPGGNENLKPETSKNAELGIRTKRKINRFNLNGSLTAYRRIVDNWIVWYGNSILTPHNIQQVSSRGFETEAHLSYRLSKPERAYDVYLINESPISQIPSMIYTNVYYAYTLSTTAESAIPNDYSIGKQLPYVPRYQVKVNSGFTNKNIDIQAIYTYTGYRFVTTDESQWLMPYHYLGLHGGYTFYHTSMPLNYQVQVRLNNLLNTQYQGIVGRMMPGRHIGFSLIVRYR